MAETHVTGVDVKDDSPTSFRAVLSFSSFRALWLAQVVSQLAQNLTWITLGAYVEEKTGKATIVSVTTASALLAPLLISAIAGVVVDRSGKRRILLGSNIIRVGLTGLFLLCTRLDIALQTTSIIILIFVASVVSQFFAPAEAAMIPVTVGKRHIMSATSLFNITFNACQLVPVMLGLVVLNTFGIVPILFAIGVLYAVATYLVARLPKDIPDGRATLHSQTIGDLTGMVISDLREAFGFLAAHRDVTLVIFQINVGPTFVFVFLPLGLKFVPDTFGLDAAHTWILLLPAGIGIAVGALVMGRLAQRLSHESLVNSGLLAMGAAIALLGAMAELVVHNGQSGVHNNALIAPAMTLSVVIGLGMAMSTIPAQTLLLERTSADLRGRVLSLQQLVNAALPLLPLLLVGILADKLGTASVMLGLGVVIGGIGLWSSGLSLQHSDRIQANQ